MNAKMSRTKRKTENPRAEIQVLIFAAASWTRALRFLETIAINQVPYPSHTYEAFMSAAVLAYMKPFEKGNVFGTYSDRVHKKYQSTPGQASNGTEFKNIHAYFGKLRNYIYAHNDLSALNQLLDGTESPEPFDEPRIRFENSAIAGYSIHEIGAKPYRIIGMLDLIVIQLKTLGIEIAELLKSEFGPLPVEGIYKYTTSGLNEVIPQEDKGNLPTPRKRIGWQNPPDAPKRDGEPSV